MDYKTQRHLKYHNPTYFPTKKGPNYTITYKLGYFYKKN
jgi:hypothetical protein